MKKTKNQERGYKGKAQLTLEQMEQYRKKNKCYKCSETGHVSRVCPTKKPQNGTPKASTVEVFKEEGSSKGALLSYLWGKVCEHDALILFDPRSTHNFISQELALKLGIHDFEMREGIPADGAFKDQKVNVTPLIGKLHLHMQGYVDKEDFYISPLKHEDVILSAPWFDCIQATMKFLEREVLFTMRGKDYALKCNEAGHTIPIVVSSTFAKGIKSIVSCYMVFVKEHVQNLNVLNKSQGETKEDLEKSKLLQEFQDIFTDDIPNEMPPS